MADGPSYTPREAIDFLEKKHLVPTDSWDDLWQDEHSHCFTVAHSMGAAVLDDIFKALSDAIESGDTLDTFKKNLGPTLREKGWYGGRADKVGDEGYLAWRLAMIYDTNLMTAYSAGNYRRMTRGAELRPIWVYSAVMDGKTRPEHRALNGKAYRAGSSFWDRYYPPNGWRCRCSTYSLSEDGAAQRGLDILDDLPPGLDPERVAPPEWRYNPGRDAYAPDWSKYKNLAAMTDSSGRSLLDVVKRAWSGDLVKVNATPRQDAPPLAPDSLRDSVEARVAEGFASESDVRAVGDLILKEAARTAGADHRAAVLDALKRIRPFADTKSVHTYAKGSSVRGRDLLAKTQAYYPKAWVDQSAAASKSSPVSVRLTKGRACYIPSRTQYCVTDDARVCAHEMAHRMEAVVDGVKGMEKSFYDRRTEGEKARTLRSLTGIRGYGADEIAKKDKFLNPYMGRDYSGRAYEILSMGVESLAGGSYDIVKDDPDYAAFIVGLLAGL
jgi:phage putative head morphogenesis protein, SPP1 gp7 family